MKFVFYLWIIFIVIFSTSIARASTYFVNNYMGFDSNSGTSVLAPWKTISHAISLVNGTKDDVAHLIITAGSYDVPNGESFPIIMKNYIIFEGTGAGALGTLTQPLIDASSTNTSAILCIGVKGVEFSKISIRGGSGSKLSTVSVGGGIYIEGSSISMKDSTVYENKADWGGGIYSLDSDLIIDSCKFDSNQGFWGGALHFVDSNPVLTNCVIQNNNSLGGCGGGIFAKDTYLDATDCNISSNSALWGGGVFTYISSPNLINCQFFGNSASNSGTYGGKGGAIYTEKALPQIHGCTFESNNAETGGGIYGFEASPDIDNCLFKRNSAIDVGGGFYITHAAPFEIKDTVFTENKAENNGGGIYCRQAMIILNGCNLNANFSFGNGGAIFLFEASTITIIDTSILMNSSYTGAGLYIDNSIADLTKCIIKGNRIDSGFNDNNGAGIYCINSSNLDINNSIISKNQTPNNGGGIYSENSNISLIDSNLEENVADNGGGGIFLNISNLDMDNCELLKNYANIYGGAINFVSTTVMNIKNSSFIQNKSFSGGAIAGDSDAQLQNFQECLFSGNYAEFGGGLYFALDKAKFTNCIFSSNYAVSTDENSGLGGALYLNFASNNSFFNCIFVNNTGTKGVVYCEASSIAEFQNTTIFNYSTSFPILVDATEGCQIMLTNCIVRNNQNSPSIYDKADISYSNVEGGFQGEGNIDSDPLFVSGLYGFFYLKQGTPDNKSPCIDAGSTSASDMDLDQYTTRADGIMDKGIVDMGYHYPPLVKLDISIDPAKDIFSPGENLDVSISIQTGSMFNYADFYLILLDPNSEFYSAVTWDSGIAPLEQNMPLFANFQLEDFRLFSLSLPSSKPPITNSGQYQFIFACFSSYTGEQLSNIASVNFLYQ